MANTIHLQQAHIWGDPVAIKDVGARGGGQSQCGDAKQKLQKGSGGETDHMAKVHDRARDGNSVSRVLKAF